MGRDRSRRVDGRRVTWISEAVTIDPDGCSSPVIVQGKYKRGQAPEDAFRLYVWWTLASFVGL